MSPPTWFLYLLTAAALAAAFAFQLYFTRRMRKNAAVGDGKSISTASQPKPKSKYASISSSDFQSPSSTPTVPQVPLDPAAQQQRRLEYTLLKAYKLILSNLKSGRLEKILIQQPLLQKESGEQKESPSPQDLLTLYTTPKPQLQTLTLLYPHYDAYDQTLPSLVNFTHIKNSTHCIFARKSKVWGSPRREVTATTQQQTLASLPGFIEFTLRIKSSYPMLKETAENPVVANQSSSSASSSSSSSTTSSTSAESSFLTASNTKDLLDWPTPLSEFNLDAFTIEIDVRGDAGENGQPGSGNDVMSVARAIRGALLTLSSCDPVMYSDGAHDQDSYGVDILAAQCMNVLHNGSSPAQNELFSSARWHWTFLSETFFITCFAKCYPKTHARYMFLGEDGVEDSLPAGLTPEQRTDMEHKVYILFQPELSFLRHNLSNDTAHTNWQQPKTERDRIRVGFKTQGRPYPVPDTIAYPAAHFIVPPLNPLSGKVVKWWMKEPVEEDGNQMYIKKSIEAKEQQQHE